MFLCVFFFLLFLFNVRDEVEHLRAKKKKEKKKLISVYNQLVECVFFFFYLTIFKLVMLKILDY